MVARNLGHTEFVSRASSLSATTTVNRSQSKSGAELVGWSNELVKRFDGRSVINHKYNALLVQIQYVCTVSEPRVLDVLGDIVDNDGTPAAPLPHPPIRPVRRRPPIEEHRAPRSHRHVLNRAQPIVALQAASMDPAKTCDYSGFSGTCMHCTRARLPGLGD